VSAVCFLVAGFLMPRGALFVDNDEGYRLLQTRQFAAHGPLDRGVDYPGHRWDPSGRFQPITHIGTEPLAALAFAGPYRLFGWPGLFLAQALALGLTLLCTFRLAELLGTRRPLVAALAAVCGTPLLFYSLTLWDHSLTAALVMLALVQALKGLKAGRGWAMAGAGAWAGLATWGGHDTAVVSAALLLALATSLDGGLGRRIRVLAPYVACSAIVLSLGLLYDSRTGSVDLRTTQIRAVSNGLVAGKTVWGRRMGPAERVTYQGWVASSLLLPRAPREEALRPRAALPSVLFLFVLGYFGLRRRDWPLAGTLLAALGVGFALRTLPWGGYSLITGLLAATPVLAYGLAGSAGGGGPKPDPVSRVARRFAWLALAGIALAAPSPSMVEWGSRYLTSLLPVLGVLTVRTLEEWWPRAQLAGSRGRLFRVVAALSLAVTLVCQVASVWALYSRKAYVRPALRQVMAWKVDAVATNVDTQPLTLAWSYDRVPFLLFRSPQDLADLLALLRRQGVRRVGLEVASEADLRHVPGARRERGPEGWPYTFATVDLATPGPAVQRAPFRR
jgi:hypothetical protein